MSSFSNRNSSSHPESASFGGGGMTTDESRQLGREWGVAKEWSTGQLQKPTDTPPDVWNAFKAGASGN